MRRDLYHHTLGVLKDSKTPRKLLSQKSGDNDLQPSENTCKPLETPIKVHMSALQRQMMELQVQYSKKDSFNVFCPCSL